MNLTFCHDKFWDLNVTWNTEVPDFTSCFQDSIFVLLPCIIFSVFSLMSICHISRTMNSVPLPWTFLNKTKVVLCIVLVGLSCTSLGINIKSKVLEDKVVDVEMFSSLSKSVTYVIVLVLMLMHRAYGVRTSTLLSIFWLCISLCGTVIFRSRILSFKNLILPTISTVTLVMDAIYFFVVYCQLFLSCFADANSYTNLEKVSPFEDVPFFSYLAFSWLNSTLRKGYKHQLNTQDFVPLCGQQKASYVWRKFHSKWCINLSDRDKTGNLLSSSGKTPSLAWTLAISFWPWIICTFILHLLCDFSTLIVPLILDLLIDFISSDEYLWKGYFYCVLIAFTDFICKILLNHHFFYAVASGGQVKSVLTAAVYRKALRISNSVRKEYPSGALTNLVSVDVQRIIQFYMFFGSLVAAPIKIILTMSLLWRYLGASSLAGVIVILILMPCTLYFSRIISKLYERQMKVKDERLKDMNEILSGIKILKLNAWEIPFMDKIRVIRDKELRLTLLSQFCYVAVELLFSCAPILIAIASFATYILVDKSHVLSPSTAFVSLNLLSILKYSLFDVPDTISELMQTNTSLGRIRKFFASEEYGAADVVGNNPSHGNHLTIKDATFSWLRESDPALKNINLSVAEGSLVAVIGPVGSGKSSLLSAILAEMYKISGSIDLKGSLAYVPQQAWIVNRTLKENILLVKSMDDSIYNEIVECCCLKPDLEILPGGDETEIGEKGINLSGGQKQRVSLARAVYQNADVYLLDDPLSAVDAHVRKDLFENVIGHTGLLKNKTRILVTHDISVLSRCDVIVSMKNGVIDEIGTYTELYNKKGNFTKFLQEHSNQAEECSTEKSDQIGTVVEPCEYQADLAIGDVDTNSKQIQYQEDDKVGIKLTEEERMEIGKVSRGVYINYVKNAGFLMCLLAILGYIGFEAGEIGSNVWLSEWSADAGLANTTNSSSLKVLRLSVYGGLGGAQVLFATMGSSLMILASIKAAKLYHKKMLLSVLKCPMSFFDTTPHGRIVNRFSSDMDIIDVNIVYDIDGWLKCIFSIIGTCIVIGMNLPLFLASLLPVAIIYFIIQKLYLNTSRQLKRLESVTKSPIFSHLIESIQGTSSIKAYKIEDQFIEKLETCLDNNILCYFLSYSANRWLSFCLTLLGDSIILVASILAIQSRGVLSAATVGLTITYALSVTGSLQWFIRCNTQLENKSVSVERLEEYCRLPSEAPWDVPDLDPSFEWPQNGKVQFENYSTRYREGLDLVLNKVNMDVFPNERVGIVGRTGAGKSSITLALFRIIEGAAGRIIVDNLDISKIGLHALRSKITIIPQDPVLFTGSIRMNLDPSKEYTDEQIWKSLEQSHLKAFVSNLVEGLNYDLTEGGGNLSLGQRQLICLARALLKKSKILIMDEATAAVDMDTDKLIQNTISSEFRNHTVITIAHRLNTIMDYDKIIVMDSGKVVEVGNPAVLQQDSETKFYSMSKDARLI